MLTNDMNYAINLPSKGQISVWTDDDLKDKDLRQPQWILILSRVLEHIMDLK